MARKVARQARGARFGLRGTGSLRHNGHMMDRPSPTDTLRRPCYSRIRSWRTRRWRSPAQPRARPGHRAQDRRGVADHSARRSRRSCSRATARSSARSAARCARACRSSRCPAYVPQAFIAVEDQRFYEHDGVDVSAVARRDQGQDPQRESRRRQHDHAAARRLHAPRHHRPPRGQRHVGRLRKLHEQSGGARDGEALHQGADPRGVPQPDQPRPRLVRRRGRVAPLLRTSRGAAHARRSGDARRAAEVAAAVRSDRAPAAREGAPQSDSAA